MPTETPTYPADVLDHVRGGGCACDLCPRPGWQCGACSIPQQIAALLDANEPT